MKLLLILEYMRNQSFSIMDLFENDLEVLKKRIRQNFENIEIEHSQVTEFDRQNLEIQSFLKGKKISLKKHKISQSPNSLCLTIYN